jgi:2-keto-4-pentenoate hydratase/2-oxohepta-3-ene-1,7-dioic acid hydratase in catechol pathway
VEKLICVGKNYLEHARELAQQLGDVIPEKPVLFIKPWSSLRELKLPKYHPPHAEKPLEITLPRGRGAIHPECEIVLKLGSGGYQMTEAQAQDAIYGVTLGLDMTLRDVQSGLKKAGHPWEVSKVFPAAAVAGPWVSVADFPDWLDSEFTFSVNGKLRQKGKAREMSLSPAACVAYASQFFELLPGDLIYTGTPAGVGAVEPGQLAELRWGEKLSYQVRWV